MSSLIPNSFQVPNAIIDQLMCELGGSSFMCLLFIIRKTKGWNKEKDFIPVSQFQKALGKGRATVFRALDELEEKGLIISKSHDGKASEFSLNPEAFTRLKNETGNDRLADTNPSQKCDRSEGQPVSKMRPHPSQKCDGTRLKNETHQKTLTKPTIQKGGRKSRLPPEIEFPDDWKNLAVDYWKKHNRLDIDPHEEFGKFKAHHLAHGKSMADWSMAWKTWYTNALKFTRPMPQQNTTRSRTLEEDLTDRSWAEGPPMHSEVIEHEP